MPGTLGFYRRFAFAAVVAVSAFGQTSFTNSAAVTSAVGAGAATGAQYSPYPSNITVSGLTGTISKVTVRFNNLSLDRADDMVAMLVGPTGAFLVVMSDVGGTLLPGAAVSNAAITLDDDAANQMADDGPLTSGTFRPTAVNSGLTKDAFPGPAPDPGTAAGTANFAAPYGIGTLASRFNGTNPNGTWSLYVVDDALGPASGNGGVVGGTLAGGWTLTITTASAAAPTSTVVVSSLNPSFTTAPSNSVTFTATVTSGGNPVTQGTVTFREGAAVLAGPSALNSSGQASFTTAALSEGSHVITATYDGTASFATSSGSVTQEVNNHTTVSGNTFCNPGPISVPDGLSGGAPATPYPSKIFVSGLSGTISRVTMQLANWNAPRPDDHEFLLTGPNNARFVVLNDAGGVNPANVTLTLDDAAGSLVPDAGPLATGTFRPTAAINSTAANFPSPAPAGPWSLAAPAGSSTFTNLFGGANPNGTWSLFVVDDAGGGGVSAVGSWCLSFTVSGDPATTTTVTSTPNPSFTGAGVTFTATVRRQSDSALVTQGAVTFREGSTVLAGPLNLNGSGQASFVTSTLTEGLHTISADYGGAPGQFNISTGSVTQEVNNQTQVTGNTWCNPGPHTIPTSGPATPYPIKIFVTQGGSLTGVSMQLRGLTHAAPDDIDVLLVSPTGAKLIPMSDVGGAIPVSNVTLTLADSAASLLPDAGPLATGTFRPTAVNSLGANAFPSPAPAIAAGDHAAPFGAATFASVYNGSNPQGPWQVFLVDDSLGSAGSLANGVCLTLAAAPDLTIAKTHSGNFTQGQTGATYTITVTNLGADATQGTVTVVDTLPAGLTATAIGGNGWSCTPATLTCTRSDALANGSYPAIALTVNVAANAPAQVTNQADVSGGGDISPGNNTAQDPTTINPAAPATTLTGLITTRTGPVNARQWNIITSNPGPNAVANAQIASLSLSQTAGAACTPVIATAFPVNLGAMNRGTVRSTFATIDFTGCGADARFTASVAWVGDGAAPNVRAFTNLPF